MNILQSSPDTCKVETKCSTCKTILEITPRDCSYVCWVNQKGYIGRYRCPVCGDDGYLYVDRFFYLKFCEASKIKKVETNKKRVKRWLKIWNKWNEFWWLLFAVLSAFLKRWL